MKNKIEQLVIQHFSKEKSFSIQLPFVSGATVFFNYVDLKIKNTLNYLIQIKLWTNGKYVKGQTLSDKPREFKFHVYEKFYIFI